MTAATICQCGTMITVGEPHDCEHRAARAQRDSVRRNSRPKAKAIWNTSQWRRTSRTVIARDGHRCVDCGRHREELNPNERLLADHLTYDDPFNPDTCVTRCSTCSGRKDGGRRYAA